MKNSVEMHLDVNRVISLMVDSLSSIYWLTVFVFSSWMTPPAPFVSVMLLDRVFSHREGCGGEQKLVITLDTTCAGVWKGMCIWICLLLLLYVGFHSVSKDTGCLSVIAAPHFSSHWTHLPADSKPKSTTTRWRSETGRPARPRWSGSTTARRRPSSSSARATSCTSCSAQTTAGPAWDSSFAMRVSGPRARLPGGLSACGRAESRGSRLAGSASVRTALCGPQDFSVKDKAP